MPVTVHVDEVGRGCLFGTVVAAAVVLPDGFPDDMYLRIRDSKKVGARERERLDAYIRTHALAVGVGEASVEEIDRYNILQATYKAMHRALDAVYRQLPFEEIRVDGNRFSPYFPPGDSSDVEIRVSCIVQGDATERGIAAASIVAKVYRDRWVKALLQEHPKLGVYGLATNMGYGTAAHMTALKEKGATQWHRRSFAPVRDASGPSPSPMHSVPGDDSAGLQTQSEG